MNGPTEDRFKDWCQEAGGSFDPDGSSIAVRGENNLQCNFDNGELFYIMEDRQTIVEAHTDDNNGWIQHEGSVNIKVEDNELLVGESWGIWDKKATGEDGNLVIR